MLTTVLLLVVLAPVATAGERTPMDFAVEDYIDDRPMLGAAASGGFVGVLAAQVHAWAPWLSGDIESEGQRLDLDDDLGLDDAAFTAMPQIQINVKRIGFRFSGFWIQYDGQETLDQTFTFGDVTFGVNEDVATDIEIQQYRGMLLFHVVDTSRILFSLQVGVAALLLDGRIEGEISGVGEESIDLILPVVGVVLNARILFFMLEFEASGMTISYDGDSGTIVDVRISVGLSVLKVGSIHIGYRYVWLEGESEDFQLNAALQGFFIGIGIQF